MTSSVLVAGVSWFPVFLHHISTSLVYNVNFELGNLREKTKKTYIKLAILSVLRVGLALIT